MKEDNNFTFKEQLLYDLIINYFNVYVEVEDERITCIHILDELIDEILKK